MASEEENEVLNNNRMAENKDDDVDDDRCNATTKIASPIEGRGGVELGQPDSSTSPLNNGENDVNTKQEQEGERDNPLSPPVTEVAPLPPETIEEVEQEIPNGSSVHSPPRKDDSPNVAKPPEVNETPPTFTDNGPSEATEKSNAVNSTNTAPILAAAATNTPSPLNRTFPNATPEYTTATTTTRKHERDEWEDDFPLDVIAHRIKRPSRLLSFRIRWPDWHVEKRPKVQTDKTPATAAWFDVESAVPQKLAPFMPPMDRGGKHAKHPSRCLKHEKLSQLIDIHKELAVIPPAGRRLGEASNLSSSYQVEIPVAPKGGCLLKLKTFQGQVCFMGYLRQSNGQKGPAELQQLIRRRFDVVCAVDGANVQGQSLEFVQRRLAALPGKTKWTVRLKPLTLSMPVNHQQVSKSPKSPSFARQPSQPQQQHEEMLVIDPESEDDMESVVVNDDDTVDVSSDEDEEEENLNKFVIHDTKLPEQGDLPEKDDDESSIRDDDSDYILDHDKTDMDDDQLSVGDTAEGPVKNKQTFANASWKGGNALNLQEVSGKRKNPPPAYQTQAVNYNGKNGTGKTLTGGAHTHPASNKALTQMFNLHGMPLGSQVPWQNAPNMTGQMIPMQGGQPMVFGANGTTNQAQARMTQVAWQNWTNTARDGVPGFHGGNMGQPQRGNPNVSDNKPFEYVVRLPVFPGGLYLQVKHFSRRLLFDGLVQLPNKERHPAAMAFKSRDDLIIAIDGTSIENMDTQDGLKLLKENDGKKERILRMRHNWRQS